MSSFRLIGPGRAGLSLAGALRRSGWELRAVLGRADSLDRVAEGVDVVLVAVPDAEVAKVASQVEPVPSTALVHLAGSMGTDVLEPHPRRGAVHPMVPLPDPDVGAERLRSGVSFAVAGDVVAWQIVDALGGTALQVADADRARYHAAACIASNHLVALMGQVQRVAASAGLALDPFIPLAQAALGDVASLGPMRALTGPVTRRDWATVRRHLDVLDARELVAYEAMAGLAAHMSETPWPFARPGHGTEEPVACR